MWQAAGSQAHTIAIVNESPTTTMSWKDEVGILQSRSELAAQHDASAPVLFAHNDYTDDSAPKFAALPDALPQISRVEIAKLRSEIPLALGVNSHLEERMRNDES